MSIQALQEHLPKVRGQYRFGAALAPTNWFQVGGAAEILYKPADTEDLQYFLSQLAPTMPITVIGVGSNIIVRDGGIKGVVIRLGRGFTQVTQEGDMIVAGAAALDVNVARYAAETGHAGLEFLVGVPGTIGGALAMNAGAYGSEIKDVLVALEAVDRRGKLHRLTVDECRYSYRHYGGPAGLIFTRAWFQTRKGAPNYILKTMQEISEKREATQPIRERTGGSTFANPEGYKAWELIDAAGCRGLKLGKAQISSKHCNFMINLGGATAGELEALGEEVRKRVKAHSGVALSWEIKRIGEEK